MSAIHKFIENKQENVYFKKNQFLFDSIINAFLTTKSVISAKNKILADDELIHFINAEIPQLEEFDIYTKLNWILSGRRDFPRCHYCDEILPKIKIPVFKEYSRWCCNKHMCNDPLYKKILQDAFEKKYGPGVRSNFQIPGMKDKIKETWKEKYGTDNPFALKEIQQKKKNTFIEHYGVDNNMKSERGLQNYRRAMQEKYGVDYTWQIPEVIEKAKQTSLERYGVPVTSQSQQAKVKQAETNVERYGGKSPMCNNSIQRKSRDTCLKKYDVEHPMQSKDVRDKQRAKFMYNDETFDSSWELAFWIFCTDNNIKIEHEPVNFTYEDMNEKQHAYFPDFRICGNVLIELKGDDQFDEDGNMIDKLDHSRDHIAEAKHKCMLRNNVIILKSKEMKQYLDYIDQKYGKGYLKQFKRKPKDGTI